MGHPNGGCKFSSGIGISVEEVLGSPDADMNVGDSNNEDSLLCS